MILTCPDCATRYFVEEKRLGPSGRTVRCASCGGTWRAMNEDAPLELTSSPEEGAYGAFGGGELTDPFKAMASGELPAPELPKVFRAKAKQQKKARDAATAGVVWTGIGACFVVLLGVAFLCRVSIVQLYPRAAGAYASIGLTVNPTGLEFKSILAHPAASDPGSVFVTGDVHNFERRAADLPPLRVALLDAKGARLATRVVTLPLAALAPGKSEHFSVMMADPKAQSANVEVAFALDLVKPKPKLHPALAHRPSLVPRSAPVPAPTLRGDMGPAPLRASVSPSALPPPGTPLGMRGPEAVSKASHD
jgi:predicted Zn finger-like uncharacterized protein